MGKQLPCEWRRLRCHIALYAALAFVTAFCGILLWVNGTAAPIVFHTAVIPWAVFGLSGHFVVWLVLYAHFGWLVGMLLTVPGMPYALPSLAVIAYTLCLAWYPVFFSFWHTVFALCLLIAATCLCIVLSIRVLRHSILCFLCAIPVVILEVYFMVWTVMFIVSN